MKPLARIPIFQGISDDELERLGAVTRKKSVGAGEVLFFEGDTADSLHVILSGSAKVYQTGPDGQVKILAVVGEGATLGELTLLDGQPRSATVEALEPTELLSISHRAFRRFVDRHPEVLWKVVQSLCDRIRTMNRETLELAFEDLPYRVIRALATMAGEHGGRDAGGGADLRIECPQLVQRVGADRKEVKRILGQLSRRGLVHLELDEIVVPDPHALERALEYAREWI